MKTSHPENLMTAKLKVSMKPIAGHWPAVNKAYNATKSECKSRYNKGQGEYWNSAKYTAHP